MYNHDLLHNVDYTTLINIYFYSLCHLYFICFFLLFNLFIYLFILFLFKFSGYHRGGISGGRSFVICQVCSKVGHSALICYHRYNPTCTVSNSTLPHHNPTYTVSNPTLPNPSINPYHSYPPQTLSYPNPSPPLSTHHNNYPPPHPHPYQQFTQPTPSYIPTQPSQNTNWGSAPSSSQNQPAPTAAWASANTSLLGPPPNVQNWFPNSGASHHVTPDPLNIQHSEPLATTNKLFMGNGQGLDIKSIGFSFFFSPFHPSYTLLLNNILHVPTITKNLLSVSQFARDNNVFFEFHAHESFVKSQASKKVLLHGILGADCLYKFQSLPALVSSQSLSQNKSCNHVQSCNNSLSCNLWHLRLGRPNFEALKSVMQHCNVPSINKSDIDFCSSCCLGKAHRLPIFSLHCHFSLTI
ncbi:unnamed protein product [Cuscuta europaea]|uniref:Uncharacterized protein n=1 Tax=Cuscuta europaea TaxID=41803 RepID=A0A9P1E623_CUSEU|nr:unnamed protein product [Cuscuta europaea]